MFYLRQSALCLSFSVHLSLFTRLGDIRVGTLVGTDSFGNKYYENNDYFFGECVENWMLPMPNLNTNK